ncbi:cupin domain-containing protein [Paracoccus suum]|uniref:Cupin domain-containing protein n=1 Tax=Paracoccus suum TaxID=2259340 RepID=A0A344PKP6_9RHOB|nr:cupin domain-containing protein [Paracoccus suum]AXC49951.1 cupin domain-containing protein [Paracoccus suum]
MRNLFAGNGWTNAWTDGVYDFDHYHRTTHEVLGCIRGTAVLRLGGPDGSDATLRAGDVVLIPAGVAHRRAQASGDFAAVGAYPGGAEPDLQRGPGEALDLPRPKADPVLGPGRGFSA